MIYFLCNYNYFNFFSLKNHTLGGSIGSRKSHYNFKKIVDRMYNQISVESDRQHLHRWRNILVLLDAYINYI